MFLFFKSLSGTVHEEQEEEKLKGDYGGESLSLTVWRKSLIVNCNGFTVIGSNGNLVYRVDSYGRNPRQLILMDGSGRTLVSMRRSKKLGIDRWSVFEGEVNENRRKTKTETKTGSSKKPICVVSKNNGILPFKARKNVIAKVSCRSNELYWIEGSYTNRSCKVVDESSIVVAEMKRKKTMVKGVYFGVEVFLLLVLPGFDPTLAMALVLLLDQMFS